MSTASRSTGGGSASSGPASSGASSSGASSSGAGSPSSRGAKGSRWGSLVPAAIVVLGVVEIALLVVIGVRWSLWWSVLIIVLGWIVGVALLVAAGQQSFVRLRSVIRAIGGRGDVQDHLSRPAFTMLAALFFFFPGILTDIVGIVLLIVPVQRRTVKAMGVGGGAERTRSVLYRRDAGGVIDGEIIIDSTSTGRPSPRTGDDGANGTPPTITPR
ncbi:FxsA family protein [Brachybacterium sp. DNPG3]